MKHLILMRHAEAVPEHSTGADFDRILTESGRNMAAQTARVLFDHRIRVSRVICSSAARTAETAEIIRHGLRLMVPISLRDELYHAPATTYLQAVVDECSEADAGVVVVGHNPGMAELISRYGVNSVPIMPSTAAVLELHEDDWSSLLLPLRPKLDLKFVISDGRRAPK